MERLVGGAIVKKLNDAREKYKGGAKRKTALPLRMFKSIVRQLHSKGLKGGSNSSWFTPWTWDSSDWKAVGTGIAYGADALVFGALESKTVKQLIKTAVATGTTAQLAAFGIVVPPSVIALGSDKAVDAFIAGIVLAHDYVVGDNPYRKTVDEFFVEADKYAPQIIKGIEMASGFLDPTAALDVNSIVQKGDIFGSAKSVKMSMADFKSEHKELLDVLRNPTKEKLENEYKKQQAEVSKTVRPAAKGGAEEKEGGSEPAAELMMPEKLYLRKARANAKKAGYESKELKFAEDGKHKLEYNGTMFGALGYGDHIIYSYLEKLGEVEKGTATKKRKVFRASHGAMKDSGKQSANHLALSVLWAI